VEFVAVVQTPGLAGGVGLLENFETCSRVSCFGTDRGISDLAKMRSPGLGVPAEERLDDNP